MALERLHLARICGGVLRSDSIMEPFLTTRCNLKVALIISALFGLCDLCPAQTSAPAPVDSRWRCIPVEVLREDGSPDRSNLYDVIAVNNVQGQKVREAAEAELRGVPEEEQQRFFVLMAGDGISVNANKFAIERLPMKRMTLNCHHEDLLEVQTETLRYYFKYMLERIRLGPPPTPAERTTLQQQIDIVCRELVAINAEGEKDDVDRLISFVRSIGEVMPGTVQFGDCFRPISDESLNALLTELKQHAVVRETATEADSSSPIAQHNAALARFQVSAAYREQAALCSKAFKRYPDSVTPEQFQRLMTTAGEGQRAWRKARDLQRRYYGDKTSATRPAEVSSQPAP